jgi:hypothetical protein
MGNCDAVVTMMSSTSAASTQSNMHCLMELPNACVSHATAACPNIISYDFSVQDLYFVYVISRYIFNFWWVLASELIQDVHDILSACKSIPKTAVPGV